MSEVVQALVQYSYALLFVFILVDQVGVPVPAVPVLLGVGAKDAADRT